MRGRKPKIDNVIPMRGDADESAREKIVAGAIRKLMPRRFAKNKELRIEWVRVAQILAEPTVDRLKPQYVDTIAEYCVAMVRLRNLRAVFEKAAKKVAESTGAPADPLAAEIFRTENGRYGPLPRTHPFVAQINEAWRQWRQLVAMLGLSPADERNMIPGQGDLFDESDRYLA